MTTDHNLPPAAKLTIEEKTIKVAEACGYTHLEIHTPPPEIGAGWSTIEHAPFVRGYPPSGNIWMQPPLYATSLDAMAEAEKTLTPEQWSLYAIEIRKIIQRECNTPAHYVPGCERAQLIADFWFYHATSAQRFEAFGKTLNLW